VCSIDLLRRTFIAREREHGASECRPAHRAAAIDLGSHLPGDQRYLVASEMLRGVIEFWSKFFEDQKLT
jgi:hypothetical protein